MLFIAGVEAVFMSMPPQFIADHPFMIIIMKKSNKLFLGHVLNPNQSANVVKNTPGVKYNACSKSACGQPRK